MKKSTKKKIRDIRSALVMVLVMVAMLSTASYAWFTLTDSPTVTNMQMTATSGSGLKVCETADGTYVDAIDINGQTLDGNGFAKTLKPVSLNGNGFSEAKYQDGEVVGLKDTILPATTSGPTDLDGYVLKCEYFLKADSADVPVGLVFGNVAQTGTLGVNSNTGESNLAGSFVRHNTNDDTDSSNDLGASAIRVGFLVDSNDMNDLIIWEPNADKHQTGGKSATVANSGNITETINISTNENGYMNTSGSYDKNGSGQTSLELFKVGTTEVKVTMFIWIQGSDEDCVNEIQTDKMEAQIQFTVVDEATP